MICSRGERSLFLRIFDGNMVHIYICHMIDSGIVPGCVTKGYHILLVEKDTLQSFLLKEVLLEAGWVVHMVEEPEEALRLCDYKLFDIALINSNYPGGINGLELGAFLINHYSLPSLMITSSRYSELENNRYFNVRQEILFKPYLLQECLFRLQEMLAIPVREFAAL